MVVLGIWKGFWWGASENSSDAPKYYPKSPMGIMDKHFYDVLEEFVYRKMT